MGLGEVFASHPFDLDAALDRPLALGANGLALARGERGQEILEALIALVPPVELLIVAPEESVLARELPLLARGEGDVKRGDVEPVG